MTRTYEVKDLDIYVPDNFLDSLDTSALPRGVLPNVFGAQSEENLEESAPGHDQFTWEE